MLMHKVMSCHKITTGFTYLVTGVGIAEFQNLVIMSWRREIYS